MSVYIIIELLSINRFHAAILRKPPLWRASSPLHIPVVYNSVAPDERLWTSVAS
jgi:hypothetical protein